MLNQTNKISVNIEDEMKRSYMDYAMSVIIGRALPDVRDGFKPVHRRCLYAMYDMGNDWNKPYKKSARVVGDVIGKYHPHGDSAVYDTIVRMAQDFSLRYPMVDGQGNFGSVDGDSPAAMRYTEIRMSQLAHEMLVDIDKETVETGPNYDDSLQEPLVLPAKIPNLLVNGSSGIAVGMATNIPPHNLGEVIDGIIACIENPDLSFEELMELIPGPDFPTAGFIYGREGIISAYRTGRGIIQMRARARVEKQKKSERESIIVTEIPYQVNKARLIEKIAELVREKKIEGISDLRDESDRDGMRIVIELKKDENPQVMLNQLYKHTQMQSSFGIIMLAIVNNRPKVLTLQGDHPALHRPPPGDRHPPHHLRAEKGRGPRPYPGRAQDRPGLAGCGHRTDPLLQDPCRGKAGADGGGIRRSRIPQAARPAETDRVRAYGAAQRHPGPGDPRHAAPPAYRTGAGKDRRRVHRGAPAHRPAQGDPRLRGGGPQDHRRRTEGDQGEVRRPPPDRDHRPDRRDHPGGHHRRGRHGGEHHPYRLHQAERRLPLPCPAPGRQGEDRHQDP